MAITNQERVGKALDLLRDGLRPFVEREMKAVHGEAWEKTAEQGFANMKFKGGIKWNDLANCLGVMINEWSRVFERTLGRAEKNAVHALKDTRNKWAHGETFSSDEVYRALDNAGLLLTAISAPQSEEIEKAKMELLRTRFDEQRRSEARRAAVTAVEGRPAAGLRPWREVVTPHVDVASGRYQQAEFAADLWQVYQGEGSDEYKHPAEFFRRTFITDGLKHLLVGALRRLKGTGGDPVVELQTNFGGGKTHSMLALYHLFGGARASDLAGADALVGEAGADVVGGVKRAVLVGTRISPGQPATKPDGTVIRTLWGEMAWQLGGKEGYKMVAADDEKATNPGEALTRLFNKYAPCLILIDEWVAYARQLHERNDLPAGTFETQFTFAQALTESAKAAKQTLLVVSVPASESAHQRTDQSVTDVEVGGSRGRESLIRLKNAIGRVESTWRPASPEEGFEIVRRRLFQPITDPSLFAGRDTAIRAFMDMYGTQHQEFPPECREMDYERRFKAAYPIHPELFDRLFNDWSTLERFQRTRGVLRLMAAVIHCLWERNDQSVAIMPAQVPIDDANVQGELTRYLDDNWLPVIGKDVDGPHSLPLALDRENPNLGKLSATRRVARAIYLGSAPTQKAANRGIDDRQIKLGCVQPGESVATFGDALRHLSNRATYLYVDAKRYWYSTQPTVARLAADRAEQYEREEGRTDDEIVRRVQQQARQRGQFDRVHACVPNPADIPDEPEARLVILAPTWRHLGKDPHSPARRKAEQVLELKGSSPRNYRNALVFLAGDERRLRELHQAAAQYLAWNSIWDEREQLNLDAFQTKQAENQRRSADETVNSRIPQAYEWALVPTQPDPKGPIEWTDVRLQNGGGLAERTAKKLIDCDLLRTQMGGNLLRLELDRIPLWRGDHVSLQQLAEDFAKYLYLPRLVDKDVLLRAVRDGVNRLNWQTEGFAYAERFDAQSGRYIGLQAGTAGQIIIDGQSVLVKPDVAARQLANEQAERPKNIEGRQTFDEPGLRSDIGGAAAAAFRQGGEESKTEPQKPKLRRFHGSVEIDTLRVGIRAGDIAREVIQHLTTLPGATVKVVLEVQAEIPDGTPDDVIRTVTENCRTLKFGNHGFEES
jgi:predicted AAA+ superfamily ATPase